MNIDVDHTGSPSDLIRALAVFAEPPTAEHGVVAEALGLGPPPDGEAYAQLFSFQLYPYASVHLGPEGMMGGVAADVVAGFWRGVGQTPPTEPDHLSALLGLYASLLDAEGGVQGAERALLSRSRAALLHEHVASWVFPFLDRVGALGGPFYRAWSEILSQVLMEEVAREPILTDVPLHLREAPPLPDPRTDGGAAFLAGLLAPVRSGMILARADLTRMGRALEVGIRMGERRYILEHLMAQAPRETLEALRREAQAWRDRHGERTTPLGEIGVFWRDRAESTAQLLQALAGDAAAAGVGELDAGVAAGTEHP